MLSTRRSMETQCCDARKTHAAARADKIIKRRGGEGKNVIRILRDTHLERRNILYLHSQLQSTQL